MEIRVFSKNVKKNPQRNDTFFGNFEMFILYISIIPNNQYFGFIYQFKTLFFCSS